MSNISTKTFKDQYYYLSNVFDQHIGQHYYKYIRKNFRIISKCLSPGAKHLDIGCGTGDLLEFSSSLSFIPTGIDVSQGMIKIARSKLNSKIDIKCCDMFTIKNERYEIITANNDVLNYMALNHDLTDIFNHIHSLLSSGGIFYADVVSKKDILENWKLSGHSHSDNKTFRCNVTYDVKDSSSCIGIVKRDWIFKENGKWNNKSCEVELLKGISSKEIKRESKQNNFNLEISDFYNGNIAMVLIKRQV